MTPLHLAAKNGYFKAFEMIFQHVKDKNPKEDATWMTPFHYAAENGHFDICQLIMECVREKNPKNDENKTPYDLAAKKGHLKICELISSRPWKSCQDTKTDSKDSYFSDDSKWD